MLQDRSKQLLNVEWGGMWSGIDLCDFDRVLHMGDICTMPLGPDSLSPLRRFRSDSIAQPAAQPKSVGLWYFSAGANGSVWISGLIDGD